MCEEQFCPTFSPEKNFPVGSRSINNEGDVNRPNI